MKRKTFTINSKSFTEKKICGGVYLSLLFINFKQKTNAHFKCYDSFARCLQERSLAVQGTVILYENVQAILHANLSSCTTCCWFIDVGAAQNWNT